MQDKHINKLKKTFERTEYEEEIHPNYAVKDKRVY